MSSIPVVFILASNYSGSHLLARLLDGHSACASVGELRNLVKFLAQPEPNASGTVADYHSNPLFTGLSQSRSADWHGMLLQRIGAGEPGVTTLIDNSKRLDWLEQCLTEADVSPRCIHLLRDPRALVRRWRATFDIAEVRRVRLREARRQWRPSLLTVADAELYGWRWLRENAAVSAWLTQHAYPAATLSYEELVTAPARALARVMSTVGLAFESGQLDLQKRPERGTRKIGWPSDRAGIEALRMDLRWRADLSRVDQDNVAAMAPLRDYLASLGYIMTESGLQSCLLPGAAHTC